MQSLSRATLSWLRAAAQSDILPSRAVTQQSYAGRHTHRSSITSRSSRPRCRAYSSTPSAFQREDTRNVPQTHYEFFPTAIPTGPPPNGPFAVDLRALRKEFLQLQAKAHPDLAPAEQKRQAEALSARINEAYKTLQSPLLRVQYLLAERGVEVGEDAGAEGVGQETLMEVLEAREEIEEATEEEEVLRLREVNEERVRKSEEIIADKCAKGDWDAVKVESVKLRYWVNIREALESWEKGKPVVLQH